MKEAVTKVIDTLTQEDFHGAFQKLLGRYKCIATGGGYFEGDQSFMCVLSIKVPIRKKVWKFNDPRVIYIYIYIYIYINRQNRIIQNFVGIHLLNAQTSNIYVVPCRYSSI